MEMVAAGFDVIGIDLDKTKITALQQGRSYILDVPRKHRGRSRSFGEIHTDL
jgi:UDP-N-acetyl-D-mannosaminuronate dehydrogenase